MHNSLNSTKRPLAIFILALAIITTMVLSSCSVFNRPNDSKTPAADSAEASAEAADQVAKDETEPSDAAGDNSDITTEEKTPGEAASGSANADTGSTAREFDAAPDMQLGALKADMPKEEADKVMKSELVDSTIRNEYGMETEVRTYKDGTVIHLLDGRIYSISVKSPDYATPRGLKTGDTEETLRKLYGEPAAVEGNKWIYSYRGYDLFFVTVENGIVTEIMISQVL